MNLGNDARKKLKRELIRSTEAAVTEVTEYAIEQAAKGEPIHKSCADKIIRQQTLVNFLKSHNVWKILHNEFDRSFEITIDELNDFSDGKIRLQFIKKYSGSEEMDASDVADYLGLTRKAVLMMTRTRTRMNHEIPLPSIPIHGKKRGYLRSQIDAWKLAKQSAEEAKLAKQRQKLSQGGTLPKEVWKKSQPLR